MCESYNFEIIDYDEYSILCLETYNNLFYRYGRCNSPQCKNFVRGYCYDDSRCDKCKTLEPLIIFSEEIDFEEYKKIYIEEFIDFCSNIEDISRNNISLDINFRVLKLKNFKVKKFNFSNLDLKNKYFKFKNFQIKKGIIF